MEFVENLDGSRSITVDLSRVGFAHGTGMVPLIATIDRLVTEGWEIWVRLPDDDFLADYFASAGWTAGIHGDEPPPPQPGKTYVPLTPYREEQELNAIVKSIANQLASTTLLEAGVLDGVIWSLQEVTDNVLLHAGEGTTGWVQMSQQPRKSFVELVVVDCGQGITASLRQAFPTLVDDREAVMKAIEQGVTRDPSVGQGYGLAGTLRIAAAAKGWANIHSGNGVVRAMPDATHCQPVVSHKGTIVEVTIPTNQPIDVSQALWGRGGLVQELEMEHFPFDATSIHFRIADETTGFGNRRSAQPLRTKIQNLLTQFPGELLTVDFDEAPLISASFADELIGRLVKELGPSRFKQSVRLVNLSNFARQTIDAVVAQRLRT